MRPIVYWTRHGLCYFGALAILGPAIDLVRGYPFLDGPGAKSGIAGFVWGLAMMVTIGLIAEAWRAARRLALACRLAWRYR